jgi:hypothetical protein
MTLTSEQQELLDECTKLQQLISGSDQEASKPEFSCYFDMLQYKKQKVNEAQRIAAKKLDKQILNKQVLGDSAYLRATLTSRMSL